MAQLSQKRAFQLLPCALTPGQEPSHVCSSWVLSLLTRKPQS